MVKYKLRTAPVKAGVSSHASNQETSKLVTVNSDSVWYIF